MDVDRERLTISATESGWTLSGEIDAHTAPELESAVSTLPSGTAAVRLFEITGLGDMFGVGGNPTDA